MERYTSSGTGSLHTASTLLAHPSSSDEGEAVTEAKEFLRTVLANGPRLSTEIQKEAKAAGISERILWHAKGALGAKAHKRAEDGYWEWDLPGDTPGWYISAKSAISVNCQRRRDFGRLGRR